MNVTLWNSSSEDAVAHFVLGGATFFLHFYAIFLISAIYDYQDEKPIDEKGPIDVHMKDYVSSIFWFIYYRFLVHFISIFTPPITSDMVYLISYVGYGLNNFSFVSAFVLLYTQYLCFFCPDDFGSVKVSTMRWLSFVSKILLTFICIVLNIAVPLNNDGPPMFQWLAKGQNYER